MIFLLANAAFLILSIGYGWLAGDRLDKQAVAWIAAALLGTLMATILLSGDSRMATVLIVDLVLLLAIGRIALRSSRYWPMWFVGFHLASVVCTVSAFITPLQVADTLRVFAGFWGTAGLLVMVLGIFLDRRAAARQDSQAQPST